MKKNPLEKIVNKKRILITGGTGSFGKAFTRHILDNYDPLAVRIFSRDELKQWEMKQEFANHPKASLLRFLIGDVRDKSRLRRAVEGCNIVVHAAALKQVPACEYNPIEAIATNVTGAINVIEVAIDAEVEKIIALSTDKASQPINLYGATKLCSDKLFIQANNYRGNKKTAFSVVRYGNVMASRGSVIPLFKKQAELGELTITDEKMTRFWISLDEAIQFVISSLQLMQGGELFVPKIPSMKVLELAKAMAPNATIKVIGVRPGEKIHESLISESESHSTFDIGDRYMISPENLETWNNTFKYPKKEAVPTDFTYTSLNNPRYLSVKEMNAKLEKIGY